MKKYLFALPCLFLLCSCSTIVPTHTDSTDSGYIGNTPLAKAVIVDYDSKHNFAGFIIPPQLRDEYNSLIGLYGGVPQQINGELIGFTPPLKANDGITTKPNGQLEMDAQHFHYLKKMKSWKDNNIPAQGIMQSVKNAL